MLDRSSRAVSLAAVGAECFPTPAPSLLADMARPVANLMQSPPGFAGSVVRCFADLCADLRRTRIDRRVADIAKGRKKVLPLVLDNVARRSLRIVRKVMRGNGGHG